MVFKKQLELQDGIYRDNYFDEVTVNVQDFYKENPFPNYNDIENKYHILEKGNQSFLKFVKEKIGFNKKILEVGCGTGQFSNYLAIGTNNKIYALDATLNSLKLAKKFSDQNKIDNITYINASIFSDIFYENSFDLVFCSGVLHHTNNPHLGFKNCVKFLKNGGYIVIGLYNYYSRFSFNKMIFKLFGSKALEYFDPVLKNKKLSSDSKNAWIKDQYEHIVESTHTFDELINWFKSENIDIISGIPKITNLDISDIGKKNTIENIKLKNITERVFIQILMNFNSYGSDGALFNLFGQKKYE